MIHMYQLLTQVLYFVMLPFAWIAAKSGSIKWRERMAFALPGQASDLWIHAASVGEVKIASHLIRYIKRERPALSVLLTVVTDAGYRTAKSELSELATVRFLPVDAAVPVALTLDRINPKAIAITETEIWPNFIAAAKVRNIPVVLINGRMSEKAQKRYRWISNSITTVLSAHEHFFFKTQADADRYVEFGVDSDRTTVAGDMKFDAPLLERSNVRIAELRARGGIAADAFLLVAGSTRPGEEELILRQYVRMKPDLPRLRLLIAPRHTERADEVLLLAQQLNLHPALYGESSSTEGSIVVVNKMGILGELYMAADLAFVGGTFVEIGGHNILEPVWGGTPVVYGPSLANVHEAAEYIEHHRYGQRLQSPEELPEVVSDLYHRRRKFVVKTTEEYRHSPTAMVGDYILKRLGNA